MAPGTHVARQVVDADTGEITMMEQEPVALGTLRGTTPAALLMAAKAIATPLAQLIDDANLVKKISGRRYVMCEGWTALAAMLGCTPHEVTTVEDSDMDGVFTAIVELRRLSDGAVVSRASAECGSDDEVWGKRARYARRSMAQTRATAKACRLAFSWVMVAAGYSATPAEEVPDDGFDDATDNGPRALPTIIPFGKQKGKPLAECSDEHLASIREWCVGKETHPDLVQAIDILVAGRAAGGDAAE